MDTELLSGRWARASLVGLGASVLMTTMDVRAQVMTDTRPMVPFVYAPSEPVEKSTTKVCENLFRRHQYPQHWFNVRPLITSYAANQRLEGTAVSYNTPFLAGWLCQAAYNQSVPDGSSPLYPKPLKTIEGRLDLSWMYPVCGPDFVPGSYRLGAANPPQYCPGAVRDPSCPINNPVEAASGTKVHSEVDIQTFGPQPMSLVRYYRSSYDVPASFVGANWQTNWHRRLDFGLSQEGVRVAAVQPDGRLKLYYESNGQFVSEPGVYDQLSKETQTNPDGTVSTLGYRLLIAETDATERYDTSGKLLSVTERNGWVTTLTYSTSVSEAPRVGLLLAVRNGFGRRVEFTYDSAGRPSSVTALGGATTRYGYDALSRLTTVTWPDGAQRRYHYEDSSRPAALTGITDESGARIATYSYGYQGRVTSTEKAGGRDRLQYAYGTQSTTVAGALGGGATSMTYSYLSNLGVYRPSSSSVACPTCGDPAAQTQYDANGNMLRSVGHDGRITRNTYDAKGRVLTRRIFTDAASEAAGMASQTITMEWHPTWRLPLKIAEPGRITAYDYDARGNKTGESIVPTSDLTGQAGFAALAAGPAQSQGWSYTAKNIVSTAIRKDGATITQSWRYLAGPLSGNLWYVTDAITDGEAVIYYTARDTIQTITPQGVTPGAAFEYDLRGRLTRSTVGGVVGNFAYDARGLYTEIRFSSGAVLQFRWNDAQQLIDIRDETGQVYAPQVAMGPDAVLPLGQALAQLYAQGRGVAERGLTALGDSLVPPAAAQVGVVPSRFLEALGLAAAAQRKPRDLGAGKCCAAGESLLSQAEGGSASDQMVLLSPWLMAGLLVTEIKDVVLVS